MERTLLLVDDEENILSALVRLFRRDGYRILRAGSGQEGLVILHREVVGVIVSDQRMPNMTGVEFLSQARQIRPDSVRIVLSGYTELSSITDAVNQGAVFKFLTKPWDDGLLRANVAEAFRIYELSCENERLNRELKEANSYLREFTGVLEQHIQEKTTDLRLNMTALQVSQEVLDHLPLGVIGIDEDDLIVLANQQAHRMFDPQAGRPLIGTLAHGRLPAPLMDMPGDATTGGPGGSCRLADERRMRYWRYRMSGSGHGTGTVLVMFEEGSMFEEGGMA